MRSISFIGLWAGSAVLIMVAPIILGAAPVTAQTMGEYGATLGQSAGMGSTASTLPAPAAYSNPVGGSGSTATVEVRSDDRDAEDTYGDRGDRDDRDSRDAKSGDEWSAVR